MISIQNRLNVSKSEWKSDNNSKRVNIIEGINKFQNGVLKKACYLNGIATERSIGSVSVNGNEDVEPQVVDVSPISNFATSTPHPKSKKYNFKNSAFNMSAIEKKLPGYSGPLAMESADLENRLKAVKLDKLEEERYDIVSLKVYKKAVEMERAEVMVMEKVKVMKEELEVRRTREDFERTQQLVREEEHNVSEALQWKIASQQRSSQRLSEANERIKRALLKQQEVEERQTRELRERRDRLEKVLSLQLDYRALYQGLQESASGCLNPGELSAALGAADLTGRLKTTNAQFEAFVDRCKTGLVSEEDLKEGEGIVDGIKKISELFKKQVELINSAALNVKREGSNSEVVGMKDEGAPEEGKEARQVEEVKEKSSQSAPLTMVNLADLDDCIEKESYAASLKLKAFLEEYEASIESLMVDEDFKKLRFACKRAVNIPVNAISPYSKEHMQDKHQKLARLLKGQPVHVGNATVIASPACHPLGIKFCTNLLAKKFVSQGEQTVSSKPEAAFAIAAICVSLWIEFPDFGQLLLAHFQRECPYLIPVLMPQTEGQSDADYYRILGYRYSDGKIESQDKFLKRMSGMMRLYAALIMSCPSARSAQHPLGLKEGWRWLAATLNLDPRADISATLILDMLEVAGSELMATYGLQFRKMLHVLCTEYLTRVEAVTPEGCGGPVGRLKTFLENVLKENRIPPPPGLLPPNFW